MKKIIRIILLPFEMLLSCIGYAITIDEEKFFKLKGYKFIDIIKNYLGSLLIISIVLLSCILLLRLLMAFCNGQIIVIQKPLRNI
jgi:hypothetical protein